jgi:hypothetical protein
MPRDAEVIELLKKLSDEGRIPRATNRHTARPDPLASLSMARASNIANQRPLNSLGSSHENVKPNPIPWDPKLEDKILDHSFGRASSTTLLAKL